MSTTKNPQDHKKSKEELARFVIEYDGESYEMKEDRSFADVSKPGFIRKNRNLQEHELMFNMLEILYSEDTLNKTVDEMDKDEFSEFMEKFGEAFNAYNGASVGE